MEKQITMSEECKRVLDTIKQGKENGDIVTYDGMLFDNSEIDWQLEVFLPDLINLLNKIGYKFLDCAYFALRRSIEGGGALYWYDDTIDKYKLDIPDGNENLQIIFTNSKPGCEYLLLFNVDLFDCLGYRITQIVLFEQMEKSENTIDTVLYEHKIGFIN